MWSLRRAFASVSLRMFDMLVGDPAGAESYLLYKVCALRSARMICVHSNPFSRTDSPLIKPHTNTYTHTVYGTHVEVM